MDRYEVISERLEDIKLFGFVWKDREWFNIRNNKTGSKIIYGYYSTLEKDLVVTRCKYLNDYDKAEKFKLFEDGNKLYWVFVKTEIEDSGFKGNNNVWYIKFGTKKGYRSLPNLITGCKTLEDGKILLQEVRKIYTELKNSGIFKEATI